MAVERKATRPADPTTERRELKIGVRLARRKKARNNIIDRKRTFVKKMDR